MLLARVSFFRPSEMEMGTELPTPIRSASEKLMMMNGAVDDAVENGSKHARRAGQGGGKKQPHRRGVKKQIAGCRHLSSGLQIS